jgi:sulfite reductase (NADPH) flavoprotein alpha-component
MPTSALDLRALQYGLMALGDREYTRFCGFGHALDAWLRHRGAQPRFDCIEVDNADQGALRHWTHHLRLISGDHELPDWQAPVYHGWRLVERRCLNPGSVGEAVFHLELSAPAGPTLAWSAGDIAEIGPRQNPQQVRAWLQRHGFDPQTPVQTGSRSETLQQRLMRSHLPPQGPAMNEALDRWLATLSPLPHREYSIASLPEDGAIHLLVRRMCRPDGSPGLGAGWLTEYAQPGDCIDLRLRPNPGFHLPPDARPLLLIGNGTGIAGLRGLLKARAVLGHHRNWLIFGERQRDMDSFYDADLQQWLQCGVLQRFDPVYSRDGGRVRYVQHRLRDAGAAVCEWVARDASIYVCGSQQGMASGVDAVLRELLGDAQVDRLLESGRYRRDVY